MPSNRAVFFENHSGGDFFEEVFLDFSGNFASEYRVRRNLSGMDGKADSSHIKRFKKRIRDNQQRQPKFLLVPVAEKPERSFVRHFCPGNPQIWQPTKAIARQSYAVRVCAKSSVRSGGASGKNNSGFHSCG